MYGWYMCLYRFWNKHIAVRDNGLSALKKSFGIFINLSCNLRNCFFFFVFWSIFWWTSSHLKIDFSPMCVVVLRDFCRAMNNEILFSICPFLWDYMAYATDHTTHQKYTEQNGYWLGHKTEKKNKNSFALIKSCCLVMCII